MWWFQDVKNWWHTTLVKLGMLSFAAPCLRKPQPLRANDEKKIWAKLHNLRKKKVLFQILLTDKEVNEWNSFKSDFRGFELFVHVWDTKVKSRGLQGKTVWVGSLASSATHPYHPLNEFGLSWDISQHRVLSAPPRWWNNILMLDCIWTRRNANVAE